MIFYPTDPPTKRPAERDLTVAGLAALAFAIGLITAIAGGWI